MAIDTREKRASVAAIITAALSVSPTVNASKDQEWRQAVGYGYTGILADATSQKTVKAALKHRHFIKNLGQLMR